MVEFINEFVRERHQLSVPFANSLLLSRREEVMRR